MLHVDPERFFSGSIFDELGEVGVTKLAIEIEAELRELDGNFGGESRRADALNKIEIVQRDCFGFGAVGDVFAEMREDGGDAVFSEAAGGGERVGGVFTGHEPRNGAAHEAVARGAFTQPRALRGFQKRTPQHGHAVTISGPSKESLPGRSERFLFSSGSKTKSADENVLSTSAS